jgi:hypothetical protein
MNFTQLLPLAFERSNQLQIYWSFYTTVVLALLAFFGSARPSVRTKRLAILVTIAFVSVSLANLEALCDVSRQRLAIQLLLERAANIDSAHLAVVRAITPSSLFAVRAFHLTFDAFTLVAVWVLALRGAPMLTATDD